MLISEERKFIFVEVPKTGTSAICERLLAIDDNVTRNMLPSEAGGWVEVNTHITCAKIKQALGPRFDDFHVVGFFRDPLTLIRSKYFFYRNGRARRKSERDDAPLMLKLRVTSAKILPLWIWSIFYPFKSGAYFVLDDQGQLLVDELGDFENLQEDFIRIFTKLGYSKGNLKLNIVNKSTCENLGVFSEWACKMSVRSKLRKDTEIYATAVPRSRSDRRS